MAAVILGSPTVIHSSFTGSIEVPSAISIGSNPINSGNTIVPTYYTKSQLRTSGEAEVHWDNITNKVASTYTDADAIAAIKGDTDWNATDWDTTYGWGNHASAGYLTSQTSHADVVVDGDFASQGIMLRGASAGTYSILTDASANWNTAYGWGNHSGLYTPISHNTLTNNPHSVTATQVSLGNVTNESKATMFTNPTLTGTTATANITVANDTKYTTAPASNATTSGITYEFTAGENLAVGEAVYVKSDGKVWKADANGASTYPAIGIVSIAANAEATCSVITHGICRQDSWGWTVGGALYLSATPGAITHTAPSGSGDKVQRIGIATHADRMLVMPSLDVITIV